MDERCWDRILIWGFAGFVLAVAAAGVLKPEQGFSDRENRYLQKRPQWSWERMLNGKFGEEYETYLGDQFPGRGWWAAGKAAAQRLMMKTDINGVYLGKDGYLMEKFDQEDVEGALLDRNLDRLAAWSADREEKLGEGHVKLMLVPSASQVLTSRLPAWAAPYDQSEVTERLKEKLGERAGMTVDVEAALAAHSGEEIYYRTDHHWTTLGAYYGYRAWAESAGREPWDPSRFRIETVSSGFLGTVQAKLNLPCQPDDIRLYYPLAPVRYRVTYDKTGEGQTDLYQKKALETRDQYRVFLDGNHGLTQIELLDAGSFAKGQKLLIVKDSFANSLAPFVINHFETVWMADLRYYRGNLNELMEEEDITDLLVVYQIPGFSSEISIRFPEE